MTDTEAAQPTALIYLNFENIPALSLKRDCFSNLIHHTPQITWVFCNDEGEFQANLPQASYVLCWKFSEENYERAPNLQAIFTPAAGKDWIAPDPTDRVTVHHGHFHGTLMAQSLLGMISYFNNAFDATLQYQNTATWERTQLPNRIMLTNQNIIIIGYGEIGKKCGALLHMLGCNIIGVKRSKATDEHARIVTFDQLPAVLPDADHVICILPGVQSTTGVITRSHLQAMKPTAVLHNMGRGNCIKEEDLVWALSNKILRGAALDVFEQEPLSADSALWQMKNVLITPHSTCFYQEYGHLFAAEVVRGLDTLINLN